MVVVVVSLLFAYRRLSGILCDDDPSHTLLSSSEVSGYLIVVAQFFLVDHDEGRDEEAIARVVHGNHRSVRGVQAHDNNHRSFRRPGRRRELTDDLGYAIFDVPAGSYTVMGIGGEPQNVVVSPGQRVGLS